MSITSRLFWRGGLPLEREITEVSAIHWQTARIVRESWCLRIVTLFNTLKSEEYYVLQPVKKSFWEGGGRFQDSILTPNPGPGFLSLGQRLFWNSWSDGSLEHSLILGIEIGLAQVERWIFGSWPDSRDRDWSGTVGAMDLWIIAWFLGERLFWHSWSDGSLDHSLILGIEIGLAQLERWIFGS